MHIGPAIFTLVLDPVPVQVDEQTVHKVGALGVPFPLHRVLAQELFARQPLHRLGHPFEVCTEVLGDTGIQLAAHQVHPGAYTGRRSHAGANAVVVRHRVQLHVPFIRHALGELGHLA